MTSAHRNDLSSAGARQKLDEMLARTEPLRRETWGTEPAQARAQEAATARLMAAMGGPAE